MTRKELLAEISQVLQRKEELQEDTEVRDIKEWDSMAAVSIISLFDEHFSTNFDDDAFSKIKKVRDLIDLVGDKLDRS